MTTTPKTIGLPPEPPIGTEWHDCDGHQWRHEPEGWVLRGRSTRHAWSDVCRYLPLTLIEPDPWPTDPLIVATWDCDEHGTVFHRRTLWAHVDRGRYRTLEGARSNEAANGCCTLTDIIHVTPVPVAELDALRACIKALGYSGHTSGMSGSLLDTTTRLLESTDALGVDL